MPVTLRVRVDLALGAVHPLAVLRGRLTVLLAVLCGQGPADRDGVRVIKSHPELLRHLTDGDATGGGRRLAVGYERLLTAEHHRLHRVFKLQT